MDKSRELSFSKRRRELPTEDWFKRWPIQRQKLLHMLSEGFLWLRAACRYTCFVLPQTPGEHGRLADHSTQLTVWRGEEAKKNIKVLQDFNYQNSNRCQGDFRLGMTKGKVERNSSESLETDGGDCMAEQLANMSIDEGHEDVEDNKGKGDGRESNERLGKLKLKKSLEKAEPKTLSSTTVPGPKEMISEPDNVATKSSESDIGNNVVNVADKKYRDLSDSSSSSSSSEDDISDSESPSPSQKYSGIKNIRIKKKTPERKDSPSIDQDIHLSLSERMRMKSGGSSISSRSESGDVQNSSGNKIEDDIIDLTSDDESREDLPQITHLKSPEERERRNTPPSGIANASQVRTSQLSASEASTTQGTISEAFASKKSASGHWATQGNASEASVSQNTASEASTTKKSASLAWAIQEPSSRDGAISSQSGGQKRELTSAERWQLEQDIANRDALLNQLRRQRNVIATVKMSSLPDHGEKLRKQIDDMERAVRKLSTRIASFQSMSNSGGEMSAKVQMKTGHGAQAGSGQPQVYKVYSKGPNGETKLVQVIQAGQNVQAPTTSGGNHVPHNPMGLKQTSILQHTQTIPPHILQQLYAANPQAMTLYGGRMTAARLREVGSVTKEAIEKLHKQLETIPDEGKEMEDPGGLKVNLMMHQRQALSWLVWRERQHPPGGILADDMGLGKTLTMISLVLKQNQLKEESEDKEAWLNRDKQLEKMGKNIVKSSATLVICPASLIHQWNSEIERRVKPGLLKVLLYHGQNRERNILKLADNDIVLTTYNLVGKEVGAPDIDADAPAADAEKHVKTEGDSEKPTAETNLLRIAWERIILDEAHNIKNRKSLSALAACRLRANFRWALTGTPIQNELLDLYSLLRFLRCSPFDEYKVWKRQVETGQASGSNRLNVLVKCLLLRRTKNQIDKAGKPLVALPQKSSNTYEIDLSKEERAVYNRLFTQSRSVLKEYLKQHEDKEMGVSTRQPDINPFRERAVDSTQPAGMGGTQSGVGGAQMGEESGEGRKKTGQMVLVMLLRLRQCCCHLSLMKDAFDEDTIDTEGLELDLVDQMKDLLLNDDQPNEPKLTKDSVLFDRSSMSSKMKAVMDKITEIRGQKDKQKCVIVSQWTKMLDIVAHHLNRMRVRYNVIQGSVTAKKRNEMVEEFNTNPRGVEVMLVSLRAGGVGLNLIGGNHLFLLDQHWNPALEDQAADRIYRVGQKKDVFIHRFLCKETVEEKIVALQKRKQTLAHNVLTGSGAKTSKLTLDDLRMIFGV